MLNSKYFAELYESDGSDEDDDVEEKIMAVCFPNKRHLIPDDDVVAKRMRVHGAIQNTDLRDKNDGNNKTLTDQEAGPSTSRADAEECPGLVSEIITSLPDRPDSPPVPWTALCADYGLVMDSAEDELQIKKSRFYENEDIETAWKRMSISCIRRKSISNFHVAWKLPFLAAVIKAVHDSSPEPYIVLGDKTGHITGYITKDVFERYHEELVAGSAITLLKMGIVSSLNNLNCRHYVTINKESILSIYSFLRSIPRMVKTTVVRKITEQQIIKVCIKYKGPELLKGIDEEVADSPGSFVALLNYDTTSHFGTKATSSSMVDSGQPTTSSQSVVPSVMLPMVMETDIDETTNDDEDLNSPRKRKIWDRYMMPNKLQRFNAHSDGEEQMDTSSNDQDAVTDELLMDMTPSE